MANMYRVADPKEVLWKDGLSTVLSRTTSLFNKDIFSDVVFVVGENKATSKSFYAHKLLLSLASPVFAHMFVNSMRNGRETIEVLDVTPRAFHSILKYIYTDLLNFADNQVAREVYHASAKYQLLNVQEKCKKYLCGSQEVTLNNACSVFENAYLIDATEILQMCYKIFEEDTQAIFQSSQFLSAQQSTVEAIIKRGKMNIVSEREVIDAVIRWGKEECKRKGAKPESQNLRACVSPFLKHIRFLSLPNDEFLEIVDSTGILTSTEACRITWKLLQPDSPGVDLPRGICPTVQKRNRTLYEPSCKKFCFPLVCTRKQMSTQFNVDIKSVIRIVMARGQIKIIGIELQIQRKMFQFDNFNVFLKLANEFSSYEEEHTVEVTGNPLRIIFEKPLYVPAEQSATADITVEDLTLSRCQSCRQVTFTNILESDVSFSVNLNGNQQSDAGIVCILKEFLYNVC